MTETYNPAQQKVIDMLGRSSDRPEIPAGLADELRADLENSLLPVLHLLPDGSSYEKRFFLNKQGVTNVHSCEGFFIGGQGEFEWTHANCKGTIVHKTIEVSINLRQPMPPTDLVEESISRLSNDSSKSISEFLVTLDEYDRAELVGECSGLFTRFTECFPPIKNAWIPQVESSLALNLAGNRIRIGGKVDLALGRPPDKVIIDFKTGHPSLAHHDDLRLYALIDFLALGQAPRKVASYYLDSTDVHQEDISETILRSASRRLQDGLVRAIELKLGGAEPVLRPAALCRWCAISADCPTGLEYLAQRNEAEGW
ncbi:MAG: PD-(D/E)XK nuclease family protein [Ilumatobacteraceae bacterium]|nr:PD-(D/E)XK nuclease family protein [Ilumatobacteraceae bacterium]